MFKRALDLTGKAWRLFRTNGFHAVYVRTVRFIRRRGLRVIVNQDINDQERFRRWLKVHVPTSLVLKQMQRQLELLTYSPTVNVHLILKTPDLRHLSSAIESLRTQIYPHWILWIYTDEPLERRIEAYLTQIMSDEPRIKVIESRPLNVATGQADDLMCFLGQADLLPPHALFRVVETMNDREIEVVYTDECRVTLDNQLVDPIFKPALSPELLLASNYIGNLLVFRASLWDGTCEIVDGLQEHGSRLRLCEHAVTIGHIPDVLYYRRNGLGYYVQENEVQKAVIRAGWQTRDIAPYSGSVGIRYRVARDDLVSIIIPTKNRVEYLERCISSILSATSYKNYEIIIVDNGTDDPRALDYLRTLDIQPNVRVEQIDGKFNWSGLSNAGARVSFGAYLLFLNNDTEAINADWLEELVAYGQQRDVGAVGAKLLFPNGTIQHAGVTIGMGGIAGHAFYGLNASEAVYMNWLNTTHEVSAVTGACMLTRKSVFTEVGGFDEQLSVAYNDVDYCLQLLERQYRVVWTPHAQMVHYESVSRGRWHPEENETYFLKKWNFPRGDQFVNPNLDKDDPRLRILI